MNKVFRYILIATIFLSCKKEDNIIATVEQEQQHEERTTLGQLSRVMPERITRMMKKLPWQLQSSYLYNKCYPDTVSYYNGPGEEIDFGDSILYSSRGFKRHNIWYDVFTISYIWHGIGVVSGLTYLGHRQVREVSQYFPNADNQYFLNGEDNTEHVSDIGYFATYNGHYISWNINYTNYEVNGVWSSVMNNNVYTCN
jgi:hypothetical protein